MSNRTALVLGASGLVGGCCLDRLVTAPDYERVTALVRRPLTHHRPAVCEVIADFDHLEDHADAFEVTDVFCCLGTTIKQAGSQEAFRRVDHDYVMAAARLAAAHSAQFLVISAMGARSSSRVFYNRTKGEMEEHLKSLGLPALHIFRPSLLLGPRPEFRLGEEAGKVAMKLITPLMVGPLRPYRPTHADTLARAMVVAAGQDRPGPHTWPADRIEDLGSK